MGKTYDQAPPEVHERIAALIEKYYPDLKRVAVRVDVLMASTDAEDGHAVTHGGYPALAVVRIVGARERAKGVGDVEITIDRDAYEAMAGPQRDALLDHELYHLELKRDREGQPKRDDHQRPCFKMRKHDIQVGWFVEIARRHAEQSHEVRQATEIFEESGQLLFGFALNGGKAGEIALAVPEKHEAHNPAQAFANIVRSGETSVTISAGGESVKVDKSGVHYEPEPAQLDDATKLAFKAGFLSRAAIQRELKVGYNMACAIIDRLLNAKIIGGENSVGRFDLIASASPAA